jgi:hypothetical protein
MSLVRAASEEQTIVLLEWVLSVRIFHWIPRVQSLSLGHVTAILGSCVYNRGNCLCLQTFP